jgi:ribonuclease D
MQNGKISPAIYINTDNSLKSLVKKLSAESLLGIDTESNSLYAYRERVCLIQISSRRADYIIDPLAIDDMSPLEALFNNLAIEKVFHAAEYDLMCLKRDYGFEVVNIFDTMIAARICGYKNFGLSHLLEHHLAIKSDKSHQRDNWGARPLPADSLRYAQMDTHYLPHLRDILTAELEENGHLAEARETFAEACENTPPHDGRTFDPDGYWALGMPQRLDGVQMAILRELYLLREELASMRDVPPFKVITNQVLVELARTAPTTFRHVREIMSPNQSKRYGERIVAAIKKGSLHYLSQPPHHRPPPADISDRYIALHTWRKQCALERGVESDVIVSKQTLWSLAYKAPSTLDELQGIRGLGPWKLKKYGEEILKVIERHERGM